MSNTQTSSSHGKLIVAVVAAALVVVLALVSAFIWPGWALNKGDEANSQGTTSQGASQDASEPTTPSIDAVALPDDASELLKAMPGSVLNYARTKADASTTWNSASPLEEYTLTYSTGDAAKDVTLVAAQWSSADNAKTQYDALVAAQTGDESASGNVKVSGNVTGAYVVKADASNSKNAVAIWQNDTVVFQATGTKEAVDRFYQKFPM